jgi:hypothetical protein
VARCVLVVVMMNELVELTNSGCRAPHRFWTTREVDIVRRIYPVGGVNACLAELPGRTASGVFQQAAKLGLNAPGYGALPRRTYSQCDHIDAEIRRVYTSNPTKGMVAALAASIGRPRWWISKRALKLGLTVPRFKEPEWTAAELEIVTRNAAKCLEAIRMALRRHGYDRTEAAIKLQIKRRSIEHTDSEHLTARGLALIMGVDSKTVARWIEREGLPAKRRGTARVEVQGGDMWHIHRRTFRVWLKDHAQCVDLRKVDKFAFFDLIFG